MICHTPFLVEAGSSSDSKIQAAYSVISKSWGGGLHRFSTSDSPREKLTSLPKEKGIALLTGDPAEVNANGESWLEAFGAWKKPLVLISIASINGSVNGNSQAYVALCKELSVPLLGIVQYGGEWDLALRRIDGLPWCGWIPDLNSEIAKLKSEDDLAESVDYIVSLLKIRLNLLNR